VNDQQLPQQLIEGFQRLVAGDYAYRLPRSFVSDEADTIALSFNAVAAELEKIIRNMQASEQRLNHAVETISTALLEVSAGNLEVHVERDYQGDQVDVLAFLVDTTIGELRIVIKENQQRNAEIQARLETLVEERTRQLREARDMAEAANRAKSIFLANMSHELRTPLNAILGFSELLTRDVTLSAAQRENLETINRSGEHLLALINDVLELSKIEAGRTVLQAEDFDLFHLLLGLEEMFHLRAEKKGVALLVERGPDVPQYLHTDQGKLRQVLINLLSNAVKFTSVGQVVLRVTAESAPLSLRFAVEDTGPGIAAEEYATLFDAFVQTASGHKAQEGTGLGLTISREFVRTLGGELTVKSVVDCGSTFEFAIPIDLVTLPGPSRLALPPTRRRAIGLEPGQPAYRVLIAEDVDTNRQLLAKLLLPLGFQVQEAVNGQEAIDVWRLWQPHVIFMDMRMPVLDGHEAVRRIKATAQGQQTIIIALTATAFEEDRSTILAEGCDGFMRKPFREAELLGTLTDLLGVRFRYAGTDISALVDHEAALTEAQLPAALAQMPTAWLTTFEQATLDGDVLALTVVIDQLRLQNQALADRLADLTQAYQLDQLLNLVRQAIETH